MNPNILTFLILSLLFLSCGTKIPKLVKINTPKTELKLLDFIDANKKEIVYDMGIQFKEDYNSGLLAAVINAPGYYRLVFMTKAGPKLFDLTFTPEKMTVNSAIKALDKKLLWYILEKDFRLIFDPKEYKDLEYFDELQSDQVVIRAKDKAIQYHYFDQVTGKRNNVFIGKKKRYRVAMKIGHEPKKYNLEHQNIALKINLSELSSKNHN